ASHDARFGEKDNRVTGTTFWVSDLALVPRLHYGQGVLEGLVVDANTGAPLAGAEVELWPGVANKTEPLGRVPANAAGLFRFEEVSSSDPVLVARHRGQELASIHRLDVRPQQRDKHDPDQTVFFTDRALYRPGQTIQYRGICIHADAEKDRYRVLPDRAL